MHITRDDSIEQFAISIGVHGLKLWNRRAKEPPTNITTSMHEVIRTSGGRMQLRSAAFGTIVKPVIEELHRKLPRGERPKVKELSG
jgi:hypothetical protein